MNPFGPPSQSPAEIKAQEDVATQTVRMTIGTCVLLYLSPHVVDYVSKLL